MPARLNAPILAIPAGSSLYHRDAPVRALPKEGSHFNHKNSSLFNLPIDKLLQALKIGVREIHLNQLFIIMDHEHVVLLK